MKEVCTFQSTKQPWKNPRRQEDRLYQKQWVGFDPDQPPLGILVVP